MAAPRKNAVCNTCTLKLVNIAYRRAPWFRLVREPLKAAMRCLAHLHRVDADEYLLRTAACYGCIRYYKLSLKEKSAVFRWLNKRVNPVFDFWLARIVTAEDMRQSGLYAQAATQGELSDEETRDWMGEMKTGFR